MNTCLLKRLYSHRNILWCKYVFVWDRQFIFLVKQISSNKIKIGQKKKRLIVRWVATTDWWMIELVNLYAVFYTVHAFVIDLIAADNWYYIEFNKILLSLSLSLCVRLTVQFLNHFLDATYSTLLFQLGLTVKIVDCISLCLSSYFFSN